MYFYSFPPILIDLPKGEEWGSPRLVEFGESKRLGIS